MSGTMVHQDLEMEMLKLRDDFKDNEIKRSVRNHEERLHKHVNLEILQLLDNRIGKKTQKNQDFLVSVIVRRGMCNSYMLNLVWLCDRTYVLVFLF